MACDDSAVYDEFIAPGVSYERGKTLADRQALFLLDATRLIRYATAKGLRVREDWGHRPQWAQDRLLADGLSRTATSKHTDRLAIDLIFDRRAESGGWECVNLLPAKTARDALATIGVYWAWIRPGNVWGGDWEFIDVAHFEGA